MARLATRLMLGEKLESLNLKDKKFKHFGAKEAVFPFDKFPKVDPVLGPEMRSTGEVLGLSDDYALAYYKSQEAAGSNLPSEGAVLISLSDKVNLADQAIAIGEEFQKLGFKIYATEGTAKFYEKAGVKCEEVNKINEGRPNVLDIILNNQVALIINTPWPRRDAVADESAIRKAAIKYKVPYITTLAGAYNTVKGIAAARNGHGVVKSLQEYHATIEEV
jgi:carbamoyl-phosphate synthase large subunit